MIVSYKHQFIFVKSRKTAGTSMEIALSTHAGSDDIVTPMAAEDELVRLDIDPSALPRNYLSDTQIEESYRTALLARDQKTFKRIRKREMADCWVVSAHASARQAVKHLGRPLWDSSYKFSIERHPYEKTVSLAWQRKGEGTIEAAIDGCIEKRKCRNYDLYSLDGKVAVDFIIKYERLAEDVKRVEERLGLDIWSRMPRAKSGFREDRRPAAEVLSAEQKAAIQDVCAEEFELMGYEK